jgi:hypothetical protein
MESDWRIEDNWPLRSPTLRFFKQWTCKTFLKDYRSLIFSVETTNVVSLSLWQLLVESRNDQPQCVLFPQWIRLNKQSSLLLKLHFQIFRKSVERLSRIQFLWLPQAKPKTLEVNMRSSLASLDPKTFPESNGASLRCIPCFFCRKSAQFFQYTGVERVKFHSSQTPLGHEVSNRY